MKQHPTSVTLIQRMPSHGRNWQCWEVAAYDTTADAITKRKHVIADNIELGDARHLFNSLKLAVKAHG